MRCEEQGSESFPAVSLSRDAASLCETLMREMLKGFLRWATEARVGVAALFMPKARTRPAGAACLLSRGFIANGREFSLKSAGNCCDPLASHHFTDASSTIQGSVSEASFV